MKRSSNPHPSAPERGALFAGIHVVVDQARVREALLTELVEEGFSVLGERVVDVGTVACAVILLGGRRIVDAVAADVATFDHHTHQFDTESTSDVIVTRARLAQSLRAVTLTQRAHRNSRSEPLKRLDEVPYLGPGQTVVAIASAGFDDE